MPTRTPADEALGRLKQGNATFVANRARTAVTSERRSRLAGGQDPFAVVLACADSRVVPELIFDQGMGDIFVIRVAGNVVDDFVTGSIEYAVGHLDVDLVVVLGHEACGAVGAAVDGAKTGDKIEALVKKIAPAVEKARAEKPGDLLKRAIEINAEMNAAELASAAPTLSGAVKRGTKIVPAYYSLSTGEVRFL